MNPQPPRDVRVVGRYALHGIIASGGMATVHYGRLLGPVGFSRTVAIKRLHAHYATDPEFTSMFLDEARLAARIRHPNVVGTLDVVALNGELFLVMEYVPGDTLANLAKEASKRGQSIPHRIVSAVVSGALHGLHAAHEAKDERGMPLGIVHRDVSPQNVHVGTDGVARVLDFGVAKAAGRIQTTREGQLKGKLSYMAPEQLRGGEINRTVDIYAVGVMLWELLTGCRLFDGDNEGVVIARVLEGNIQAPSQVLAANSPVTLNTKLFQSLARLDACVLRALSKDPAKRFQTAREMARELEECVAPTTLSQVSEWVEETGAAVLQKRASQVAEIESYGSNPAYETPEELQRAALLASEPGFAPLSSHPANVDRSPHSLTPTPGGLSSPSASISFTNQVPTRRNRTLLWAGLGMLLLLSTTVLGLWLVLRDKGSSDEELSGMATPPTSTPTVEAEPSAEVLEFPPPSDPEPAQVDAAPTVSAAPSKPPPPRGDRRPTTTTTPRTPQSDCLEPYIKPNGSTGYRPCR